MALKQLLVSPRTRKASGFSLSNTFSILTNVPPIAVKAVEVSDSKKISGLLTPNSLKKISFNS